MASDWLPLLELKFKTVGLTDKVHPEAVAPCCVTEMVRVVLPQEMVMVAVRLVVAVLLCAVAVMLALPLPEVLLKVNQLASSVAVQALPEVIVTD